MSPDAVFSSEQEVVHLSDSPLLAPSKNLFRLGEATIRKFSLEVPESESPVIHFSSQVKAHLITRQTPMVKAPITRVARETRKKHEMELKGGRDLVLGSGHGDASEMVGGAGVSQNHARSCS